MHKQERIYPALVWFSTKNVYILCEKNYISLYVMCTKDGQYLAESYKERLPKASIGKSCIRFKHLSDVDLEVIEQLLKDCRAYA